MPERPFRIDEVADTMSPELKQKLKKALAGKTAVEMGQFQFLNLDDIRSEAGRQWPQIRAKTYEVSGHFIEKRLDEDDVFIRVKGGFLIIFKELGGVEAEARVCDIQDELNAFFLGEKNLEKLRVAAEARRVPTDEFLTLMAQSQVEDEAEYEVEPQPETHEEAAEKAAAAWKDIEKRTDKKPERTAPDWPDEAEPPRSWDDVIFRPVWDASAGRFVHNTSLARRYTGSGWVYGRETLTGEDEKARLRDLDREVAMAAQRGFQSVFATGGSCSVVIPVHYETLTAISERMDYFSLLQAVPQRIRRFFQLRVASIPEGAPIGQMQEVFRSMRHFGSLIVAELFYERSWDLRRFESCGVSVFATALPDRLASKEPTDEAVGSLLSLVEIASQLGAGVQLEGVQTQGYLDAGIAAGVRLFSGSVLADDQQQPSPPKRFTPADIRNRANKPGDDDIAYV